MTNKIGFIGYSDDSKFDNAAAKTVISLIFDVLQADAKRHDYEIEEIVSGLTNVGIPKLVYEEATRRGLKTVGFACSKAYDYELFPCDTKHIIGDEWGDESESFLEYIDGLVKLGGGPQSSREFVMFLGKYPQKPAVEFMID